MHGGRCFGELICSSHESIGRMKILGLLYWSVFLMHSTVIHYCEGQVTSTTATSKKVAAIPREIADLVSKYMEKCSEEFRGNVTSVESAYLSKSFFENTPSCENVLTELLDADWEEEQRKRVLEKQMKKENDLAKLKEKGKKPATLKPSKKNKDKPSDQQKAKPNKIDKLQEYDFKERRTKAYMSNRSFQWKLFLRWLIQNEETISGQTKGRLKEFYEVYNNAIACGLTEANLIDCVLNAWTNPSKITKLSTKIDVKKLYNSLVSITSGQEIETPCADLIQEIYAKWPAVEYETAADKDKLL